MNQYDNPKYAQVVSDLKDRLAKLRKRVGDTGQDHPAAEAIIQEFWDYDEADRQKAIKLSAQYLHLRENAPHEKFAQRFKTVFLTAASQRPVAEQVQR